MKKITKETKKILQFNWGLRIKLRAEGDKLRVEANKLWAEGDKLRAEGYKLWAEADKLRAEADKLRTEGDKFWAEADKLWAETILEFCGNTKLEWIWIAKKNDYSCKLENGEVFNP